MPTNKQCATCEHWDGDVTQEKSQGFCHFYPPRVITILQQVSPTGQAQHTPITLLPAVLGTQWCAHHSAAGGTFK